VHLTTYVGTSEECAFSAAHGEFSMGRMNLLLLVQKTRIVGDLVDTRGPLGELIVQCPKELYWVNVEGPTFS